MTSSTNKDYSLDSENDFRSGCWNVGHQQQFFSKIPSNGRSHNTNCWCSLTQNYLLACCIFIELQLWYAVITNCPFGLFVLRPGSVAVEFKLTFKRELKDEEALAPLKEGIKNGKMGSLTVDPESLEVKKNNKGNCSYNPDAIILLLSFFKDSTDFSTGKSRERRKKQNKTESPLYLSILPAVWSVPETKQSVHITNDNRQIE